MADIYRAIPFLNYTGVLTNFFHEPPWKIWMLGSPLEKLLLTPWKVKFYNFLSDFLEKGPGKQLLMLFEEQ